MIKPLWFMVKVGFLVALALWVVENPGFVEIEWLDYAIRIHIGLFLVLFIAVILLSIFIYRVIRTFVDFPKSFRRYKEINSRNKGYNALTLGLTAVAAGDTKSAISQARLANKYLDHKNGLVLLLQAQAARLDGREEDAHESFVALLENKEASFLGVRGLLQTALDLQNYEEALDFGRQALEMHPKQDWIIKTVYGLEIRQRDWGNARKTLVKAEKLRIITKEKAKSDRCVMFLAEAEILLEENKREEALNKFKKAYNLDSTFIPAITQLARFYNQAGNYRKAIAVIEKSWKYAPHPEFVKIWDDLRLSSRFKKKFGCLQWFKKLLSINPDVACGQLAAGEIALEEGLWGEARTYFKRAEELEPTMKLYRLLASLEERSSQNGESAIIWLEKAALAPVGKVWMCVETSRIYENWHPIAQPHGSFNTIEWCDSHNNITETGLFIGCKSMVDGFA
ncbi:MAG: heme biosynthesis protein HemY [Alphaproteobacteria bacterium]|nr:heme biosynthesis protein HemY [Alphaproteobacteria bacterium]